MEELNAALETASRAHHISGYRAGLPPQKGSGGDGSAVGCVKSALTGAGKNLTNAVAWSYWAGLGETRYAELTSEEDGGGLKGGKVQGGYVTSDSPILPSIPQSSPRFPEVS